MRNTDCADFPGAETEPFVDGDSNFLSPGTTLPPVVGAPTTDRLAVFHDDAWRLLST